MKPFITAIIIVLCIAVSLQAWNTGYVETLRYDVENEFEGFVFSEELNYEFYNDFLLIFSGFTEVKEYLVMSIDYHPNHYELWKYDYFPTIFKADQGSIKEIDLIYKIYTLKHEPLHIYDKVEDDYGCYEINTTNADIELNLSEAFNYEEGICIKRIECWANVKSLPKDKDIDVRFIYMEIDELTLKNPTYDDYAELTISTDSQSCIPGEVKDFEISFYYGYPTQEIDIYIAFYNNTDLYFYPGLTTTIENIRLTMPQYTMLSGWIDLFSLNVDDLNFVPGKNYYTIGMTKAGDMNFLNELVVRTLNYDTE